MACASELRLPAKPVFFTQFKIICYRHSNTKGNETPARKLRHFIPFWERMAKNV